LHSLAKSVTDQAMTDCLRRSGIDYAQGCHIGVPRSIVETFAPRLSATT
jgi:EAL domain-containing protein (putative c-di-GMP-specific phosphodiesterase class I)